MTNDRMALQALLEKTPHADYFRQMIGFAAQRLMEPDIESRTGAVHGERSADRLAQRNGYRDRARLADARRDGRTAHSQAAQGQLLPEFPRAAPSGGEGDRRGCVTGLCPWRLDPLGRRPRSGHGAGGHLQEPSQPAMRGSRREGQTLPWPPDRGRLAIYLARRYLKVRRGGRIVSAAVVIAIGVNGDGRHEVLGVDICPSEAETFWTDFLRKLPRRGLRGASW
jgi:putative transposase